MTPDNSSSESRGSAGNDGDGVSDQDSDDAPGSAGDRGPPTPVRAMMGQPEIRSPEELAAEEAPSREIEVDGEPWIAQAIGHTRSGTAPDPGAPLILVGFRPSGATDDPAGFEREALGVSESLADLSDLELEGLFRSSRPFRPVPAPEEREDRRTSPVRKNLKRRD